MAKIPTILISDVAMLRVSRGSRKRNTVLVLLVTYLPSINSDLFRHSFLIFLVRRKVKKNHLERTSLSIVELTAIGMVDKDSDNRQAADRTGSRAILLRRRT